jgi:hypothetical protein
LVPAKRLIETPGTRCSASVTERSGSAADIRGGDRIDHRVGIALDSANWQGWHECL